MTDKVTRRAALTYLSGGVVSISGCSITDTTKGRQEPTTTQSRTKKNKTPDSNVDDSTADQTSTDEKHTATREGTESSSTERWRRVRIADIHRPKLSFVDIEVNISSEYITPGNTATVDFALTNSGDTTQRFSFGYLAPFSTTHGNPVTDGGNTWVLRSVNRSGQRTKRCWLPETEYYVPGDREEVRLAPNETVSCRVEFWADIDNEVCMPTGLFEYDDEFRYGPQNTQKSTTWSVTFEIINA